MLTVNMNDGGQALVLMRGKGWTWGEWQEKEIDLDECLDTKFRHNGTPIVIVTYTSLRCGHRINFYDQLLVR